jgi:hypothetical protein
MNKTKLAIAFIYFTISCITSSAIATDQARYPATITPDTVVTDLASLGKKTDNAASAEENPNELRRQRELRLKGYKKIIAPQETIKKASISQQTASKLSFKAYELTNYFFEDEYHLLKKEERKPIKEFYDSIQFISKEFEKGLKDLEDDDLTKIESVLDTLSKQLNQALNCVKAIDLSEKYDLKKELKRTLPDVVKLGREALEAENDRRESFNRRCQLVENWSDNFIAFIKATIAKEAHNNVFSGITPPTDQLIKHAIQITQIEPGGIVHAQYYLELFFSKIAAEPITGKAKYQALKQEQKDRITKNYLPLILWMSLRLASKIDDDLSIIDSDFLMAINVLEELRNVPESDRTTLVEFRYFEWFFLETIDFKTTLSPEDFDRIANNAN